MDIHIPSLEDLKRAIHLHEGIEKLRTELISLLGGTTIPTAAYTGSKRGRKPGKKAAVVTDGTILGNGKVAKKKKAKRVMSPEAREKIAEAQRKRWAKTKRAAKKAAAAE